MTQVDLQSILPVSFLIVWSVALLVVDLFIKHDRKSITAWLAVLGLAITLGITLGQWGTTTSGFGGMVMQDGFALFLDVLFLASGLVAIALAHDYLKRMNLERGEYFSLLLFSVAGMMLISQATNLILIFISLELLSIPLYVLTGFARPNQASEEAALKYFLLGTFSSAFLLYGVALIFGATATTALTGIVAAIEAGTANMGLLIAGALMVSVGFAFKVAVVPFHEWAPDVYQGAPTPISSFMAVAVKAAGFAALIRVFITAFPSIAETLTPVAWVIAALTMLVGNILAVSQTNLKRMLAYSSISHAGYILMAFVAYGNPATASSAIGAMLYYLVAYGITTFGAWSVVIALEQAEGKGLELDDYSGVGHKYPWMGLAMLVFMLSLTGVPLTIGFWGKFFLFSSTIEAGNIALTVIAVISSLISAYYYLRVVVYMFFRPGEARVRRDGWLSLVAIAAALAVVVLSLLPNGLLQLAMNAVIRLQ